MRWFARARGGCRLWLRPFELEAEFEQWCTILNKGRWGLPAAALPPVLIVCRDGVPIDARWFVGALVKSEP